MKIAPDKTAKTESKRISKKMLKKPVLAIGVLIAVAVIIVGAYVTVITVPQGFNLSAEPMTDVTNPGCSTLTTTNLQTPYSYNYEVILETSNIVALSNSGLTPKNAAQVIQTGQLNATRGANQIAWSPNNKWIAVATSDVKIYDAQTLKFSYSFNIRWGEYSSTPQYVAFSPDSQLLAVTGGSGFFVYNVDGWGQVFYKSDIGIVGNIAFSPDGKMIALAVGNAVQLWNVDNWTVNSTLPAGSVTVVAFSPDGITLAAGGGTAGTEIKLWDYRSGKELNPLTGHTNWINGLAFSPDGRILASGSTDKLIWLWNMTNGHQIRVLTGHTGYIESVAFSPDGQLLASGSWDLTVKLWDVKTGQELRSLTGHTGWINTVTFSPDGEALASGANSDPVLLWGLSTLSPTSSVPSPSSTINITPNSTSTFSSSPAVTASPSQTPLYLNPLLYGVVFPILTISLAVTGLVVNKRLKDTKKRQEIKENQTACEIQAIFENLKSKSEECNSKFDQKKEEIKKMKGHGEISNSGYLVLDNMIEDYRKKL
jgi:WD40 repeat protein